MAWNQLKSYFTTTPTTKPDKETGTCATALQLIKEGLYQAITSRNRWEDLQPLFKRRMEYPSCKQMRNLTAGSTNWYVSKAVPDLCVCAACYLDHFVLDHANSWELVYPTEEQEQQIFECAMHTVIFALWISYKRISIAENTARFFDINNILYAAQPSDHFIFRVRPNKESTTAAAEKSYSVSCRNPKLHGHEVLLNRNG